MTGLRQLFLWLFLSTAATGHAASIGAAWNPSPGDNVGGYFLYVGTSSGQYDFKINVAGDTQFTVVGLPTAARYYFAVTAYNFQRAESGFSNEASAYVPFVADPLGTEVVEFYEPFLDHYFITADAQEMIFAESGAAGWWRRTGRTFRSGGTVPVCRFHGNLRIDPTTGVPYGPMTYYYSSDIGNCNFLNQILDSNTKSMVFDRFDFYTTPAVEQTCPAFLSPVYRAYNNGFALGFDSNHRYSTDRAAILEVVERGWIDEGIRFCAPS
ncbi:MAG: fibronectin type III domain-containing protein [Sterolibacteriaceae bacterium]|nr:fibronectin type III domain-containing protein [Sterolibacteriaceae bacterium]MBK9086159.1 fibronectin type III domain-containing protein [Sterolibacteriaceae bacterium]